MVIISEPADEVAAVPAADDFFGRAAVVDVDPVHTKLLQKLRRLGKGLRVFAEHLHDVRPLDIGIVLHDLCHLLGRAADAIGRDKLAKDDATRLDELADLPISRIGVAVHRCQCDDGAFGCQCFPVEWHDETISGR